MATQEKTWNVANRLHSQKDSDNPEVNHIIAGADEIYDDAKGAKQSDINAQADAALADRYTKTETYSKEQLDSLITTPDVNHVSVVATNATTAVTDILPATGEANTIYRVGNWNGTQYDPTMYALFAWNGTAYVCLAVRSFVGEVYDISVNHPDGQGNPTPYANLAAAIGTNGENIPADIRRGGMSIKFIQGTVQSYDNMYVQYRLMFDTFTTNTSAWQGVDDEVTSYSKSPVSSKGIANKILEFANYFKDTKPSVCLDDSEADFNIVDILGYVLAEFKGGHIKTKNFDSRTLVDLLNKYTYFSYTTQDGVFIADENGYVLFNLEDYISGAIQEIEVGSIVKKRTIQDGLFISDESGNVYVDFSKGIKTRNWDGNYLHPSTSINRSTTDLTGCINKAFDMIHTKWPTAQVFVVGVKKNGRTMADANSSYLRLNSYGQSKNQYNKRIKECADLAGFTYIDMWSEIGIDPLNPTQAEIYYHNAQEIADRGVDPERINDRVHVIQAGHERMAKVIYNHIVNTNGIDTWQGKKAIFFGDSTTDNLRGMHTDKVYYSYLTDWLHLRDDGMNPNGYSTKNTIHYPQNAGAYGTGYMLAWEGQGCLYQRIPNYNDDYELIVIMLGSNDFGQPLGEIYNY